MAVVIAAPASGSGKTLLSLTLLSWARHQGKSIQPFKVGPDYLDPQLLSAIAERPAAISIPHSWESCPPGSRLWEMPRWPWSRG